MTGQLYFYFCKTQSFTLILSTPSVKAQKFDLKTSRAKESAMFQVVHVNC